MKSRKTAKDFIFLKNSWTCWHSSPIVSVKNVRIFHKSKLTSSILQMLYEASWRNSSCFPTHLEGRKITFWKSRNYTVMSIYISEKLIFLKASEHKICLCLVSAGWRRGSIDFSNPYCDSLLYFIRIHALLVISMPLWYVFSFPEGHFGRLRSQP